MNNRGKNNTINSTGNKEKEIQQKENLFNKTRINIEPINNSNEKEAQQRIKKFLMSYKEYFFIFCNEFEKYRINYKEKRSINEKEEKEFKEYSHKFNKTMDTFLEEITDLPESNDIGKLLLEMLTYMQVAQAKNTRIHIRLHKNKMEQAEEKIEQIKGNLKNIYTGFISVVGVFLGIFILVSVNINFFGNIVKAENSIKEIVHLFILVNMMTIISLITLIGLVYIIICLFNDKKINYKWLYILIIPFILLILGSLIY